LDFARAALYGVLPGIAAGLLLVGLFGRRWCGLAVALGMAVAYCLLKQQWLPLPNDLWAGNNDGTQWLLWGVLAAGVASAAGGSKSLPVAVAWPAALGSFSLLAWLMLTNLRRRWTVSETSLHLVACVLLLAVCWFALRRAVLRWGVGSVGLAAVLVGILSVDAGVLLLGRSALQGQLVGGSAAALGACAVTAFWRRPFVLPPSFALPLAIAHGGMLLAGYHFSYLSVEAGLCALFAPLGLLVIPVAGADDPVVRARWRRLLGAALCGMMGAAALWLSMPAGGGASDYGY
jgi:hypothetical protein